MVDAQIAPLEESLKALLVDIVRRCQSTVAQNYGRINPTSPAKSGGLPGATAPPRVEHATTEGTLMPLVGSPSLFEEPPLLTANEVDAIATLFPSLPYNDASDSGYGSQRTCNCISAQDDILECKFPLPLEV